jgi:predicted GNAT family acetyltransferase
VDNQTEGRFEIEIDGRLAQLVYEVEGDRLTLIHTEVPAELEGQGVGGRLVTAAVERSINEQLTNVPVCPFARGWLERHADVAQRTTINWPS